MKVGIMGCSGYAGRQLVQILYHHSEVEITSMSSNQYSKKHSSVIFSHHLEDLDIIIQNTESFMKNIDINDVVFLALPHGVSMNVIKKIRNSNSNILLIDLSADFRFLTKEMYESWYDSKHTYDNGIKESIYGLSEFQKSNIKLTNLIGNPGCYPTAILLGLLPILSKGFGDYSQIIIDAKSGYTGAGINPEKYKMLAESIDTVYPYGGTKHRHIGEIEEYISDWFGCNKPIQFIPHLIPVKRGIIVNIYIPLKKKIDLKSIYEIFNTFYKDSIFIKVKSEIPKLHQVIGTNQCLIGIQLDKRTNRLIITSIIDNLIKGAAGQAVQNMNIRLGFPEKTGLEQIFIGG